MSRPRIMQPRARSESSRPFAVDELDMEHYNGVISQSRILTMPCRGWTGK